MGIHKAPRTPSVLTRGIVVGGAAVCCGVVAEMTPPTADALSILISGRDGNTTQINVLEGNIIDPQLSIGGDNVSNNSTVTNVAIGNGNYSSTQINLTGKTQSGSTVGNGNTTQIDILSGNIINPQISFGGSNYSNNSSINNVSVGNGNHSITVVTSTSGSGTNIADSTIGSGNTSQTANHSGNITNSQRVSDLGSRGLGSSTSGTAQRSFGLGSPGLASRTSANAPNGNGNGDGN
jgi:hypothetical protein